MQDKQLYVMAQLDKKTCEAMRRIYNHLRELGIESKRLPKAPFHITLGAYELDQEENLKKRVEEVCRALPCFPLSYNHIGLFGLNVLFFGPDVNRELLALEQPFRQDRIQMHEWTAHTTLLMDEPEVILKAVPVVAEEFHGFHAMIESVSLYEFWPSRQVCECQLKG